MQGKKRTKEQIIEKQFRVWAFQMSWASVFRHEQDMHRRFLKALEYSSRPVTMEVMKGWYGQRHSFSRGGGSAKSTLSRHRPRPSFNGVSYHIENTRQPRWDGVDKKGENYQDT